MKTTARAHSNIAFIKYWGRKDELLRLPTNSSISMNLSNLFTTTTVEFSEDLNADQITINDERELNEIERVVRHLDRVRILAHSSLHARVVSENNFPTGTGLSSSASGFAALTLAASTSVGLSLSEKELSILARLGSGSACRSIPNGFVEWERGESNETSFAHSLFPADYWDIIDIVVVVSTEKKSVPTSEGQKRTQSSVFFNTRISNIEEKITLCKNCIRERNFPEFGKLIEMEALELHAIMLTSWPPLLYWLPESLAVMKSVQEWRQEGLPVFFTVNTGQDIHIICQKKNEEKILKKIKALPRIRVISNSTSQGTYLVDKHLF